MTGSSTKKKKKKMKVQMKETCFKKNRGRGNQGLENNGLKNTYIGGGRKIKQLFLKRINY